MSDIQPDVERGISATNPSVDDRALLDQLLGHGAEEADLLARYEALHDGMKSTLARYLVKIIVEDEQRHHRVIKELAHTIAWGGLDRGGEGEGVPPLGYELGESREFVQVTHDLLELEREDHRELRKLRRRLHDFEDTTAWTLLVDTMILDTKKHIRVLRFLLRHLAVADTEQPELVGAQSSG